MCYLFSLISTVLAAAEFPIYLSKSNNHYRRCKVTTSISEEQHLNGFRLFSITNQAIFTDGETDYLIRGKFICDVESSGKQQKFLPSSSQTLILELFEVLKELFFMATCEFAIKELYINRDFRYRKSKTQQKFTVGAGFTRANITFKVRVAKLSECNVSELKTWQKIRTELRIEEVAVYKTILLERMLRHFGGLLENANDLLLALYKSPEAATGSELEQPMTQMTLDPGDLQAEGETEEAEEAGLLETALFPRCVILQGEEFYSNKPDEDFVVEFQGHEGTAGGIEDSDD